MFNSTHICDSEKHFIIFIANVLRLKKYRAKEELVTFLEGSGKRSILPGLFCWNDSKWDELYITNKRNQVVICWPFILTLWFFLWTRNYSKLYDTIVSYSYASVSQSVVGPVNMRRGSREYVRRYYAVRVNTVSTK